MNKESCIQSIKNNYLKLRPSEEKVANYVIKNMKSIPKLSINELAETIDVSQATIIRFVKNIGYDGYRDFKDSIILELGKML